MPANPLRCIAQEQFEAFGEVVNALTDKNSKFIQDEYQNQAKKLE